jgi:endoglucanase
LTGLSLYIYQFTPAAQQAAAWRTARPQDAQLIDRIAAQPTAHWLGDWTVDPRGDAAALAKAASQESATLTLVLYNIPKRDCGSYSAGGARDETAYRKWIDEVARGLSHQSALIILEPDALADMDCLSPSEQSARLAMLNYAVQALSINPNAYVYLDAGNARWQPVKLMAERLGLAGIDKARGFSLNVSNFLPDQESLNYGSDLSAQVGGKPFVIDTSRNGAGPAADLAWCNPAGRKLGRNPTLSTGQPLIDAYLWIKYPGESDGDCNGGPRSGVWWPEYAIMLAS